MDWVQAVNGYCERTDASYWSEPVNAVTNAAFLLAAVVAWRLADRAGDGGGRTLSVILGAIGIGSFLFHTHAQVWAALADVLPIQLFILVYLYLATVRFFAVPPWGGAVAVAAFFPYSIAVAWAVGTVFGDLNGSVGYVPVPLLIAGYAWVLRRRSPETARGLAGGAALLALSLVFRTIDEAVCPALPLGTHFLWHLLNAGMLAWMIRVLVRHGPAPGQRAGAAATPASSAG